MERRGAAQERWTPHAASSTSRPAPTSSAPQSALDCVAAAGNDPTKQRAGLPADDYFDSIIALDLRTGAVRWATQALPFDAWTVDCVPFLTQAGPGGVASGLQWGSAVDGTRVYTANANSLGVSGPFLAAQRPPPGCGAGSTP